MKGFVKLTRGKTTDWQYEHDIRPLYIAIDSIVAFGASYSDAKTGHVLLAEGSWVAVRDNEGDHHNQFLVTESAEEIAALIEEANR